MALYETSMSKRGYHAGMSMIEVLISTTFTQDFDLEERTADHAISRFVESVDNKDDLVHLKGDIENLLQFKCDADLMHYFYISGGSYWPPDEDMRSVFGKAVKKIDEQTSQRT